MTFKNGPEIESLMYNKWKLLYDVINHPVDPVTGESSYASKKLPPRLKEQDDNGNFKKIKSISRVKFLQSYYGIDEATRIIKTYGGINAQKELNQLEEAELSEKDNGKLRPTTYFDRRTALMELFGDVMVLQEARRLLRQPEFLSRVAERNVNLYNELKDDIIRAKVLNDMAKGKSDIVKFTLAEKEPGQHGLLNTNRLLRTQEALSKGIANNIYYGVDSMPIINGVTKFSLSEVLDQESDSNLPVINYKGYNKKYENNYKDIYDRKSIDFKLNHSELFTQEQYSKLKEEAKHLDNSKNYYIKALQYSDNVDTLPGSVKLHTLKSYEEVETEVVRRTLELINLINISPENTLGLINPFLIQEYKEDYIDRMLEKAINEKDQAYIDHFTALKNDDAYRKQTILKNQELQYESIVSLLESIWYKGDFKHNFLDEEGENSEAILTAAWHNGIYTTVEPGSKPWNQNGATVKYEEPNGLKLNPFFAYLFINDVLSNRYTSNPINQTVDRKPFKRSQYNTTLTPLDSYTDENLIKKVFENYSHTELKNPAFIYSFLNMQKNEKYINNWEKNRKVLDYNNKKTFKFDKSDKEDNILSLNSLASRNVNSNALWCTGQRSLSFATDHLTNGDFFIVSDNNYNPVIAVRFDDRRKLGIGEIVGIQRGQSFKVEEMPLISEVFKLSNVKNKQDYVDSINLAHSLLTNTDEIDFEDNGKEENSKLIRNVYSLVRGNNFRFELDIDSKTELEGKINNLKTELKELDLLDKVKNLSDLMNSNYEILLDHDQDLELLKEQEEITDELLGEDIDEEYITIDFSDGEIEFYNLPNLKEISVVEFKNAYTFNAPNLREGIKLSIQGKAMEGSRFVTLPDNINYDLSIDAKIESTDDFNSFEFSNEVIDFNNNTLSLVTSFDNVEESYIALETALNTDQMYIYGLANEIQLPDEVRDLMLYFGDHGTITPEKVKLYSDNIGLLRLDFTENNNIKNNKPKDLINMFEFPTDASDQSASDEFIGKTTIVIKEKLTDELKEVILKSDLGSKSNVIDIIERISDPHMYVGYSSQSTIIKDNTKNNDIIKFSLAEEENGSISNFLEGLPFSEQWIVARDIDTAINKAKMASSAEQVEINKLRDKISKTVDPVQTKKLKEQIESLQRFDKITFKVPSRSKMSDKSTAYFIIQKVAEGYNDFEFKVKKNATGPLTAQVLAALDFKSKKYQETVERNNNIERTINEFIEENKGISADETFSPETAKNLGKNIGKHQIYLPPEDEDFEGLLYTLAGAKGKKGEEQLAFLRDNLLKPYSVAMLNLMKARQTMYKDWKNLINNKHKGINKLLKSDSGYGGYLVDQAVRVYLWKKAGYEIPGLDKKDIFHLLEIVRTNPKLRSFADDVSLLSKQANGWTEPGHNWGFGSVVGDINDIISKSNRKKYLEPWTKNIEKAFSKENMSKIEAIYGRSYAMALRNSLERMKTGTNRVDGSNDKFLNWLNGATAVTMFANMRSAVLQTLGAINFINTSDNNILKATAALLNVPQYTKDFFTIWNSDYLKDRRSGLMNDVAEAEIAQLMNDPRNKSVLDKFKAVNYWLLKQGYAPTRFADSFAIAIGGAGFYRNRLKTYIKSGMTQEEAEKATMRDFYEVSEQSQQSADVSKISMNQASIKGRLILAFQNTPLQYSRLIKRSVIDLIKGRGSVANNVAKILYYGAIQNIMFNFMQNALFSMLWDDDEEQAFGKFDTAKIRAISGTMDTILRGSGLQGAILATVKNIIVKWYEKSGDPKGYGDVLLEVANLSPSIGIKTRALAKSYKAIEYNKDEIMYKGFSTDNTYAIEALTSLTSAATNFPADRLMTKVENVHNALNSDYEAWQRVAFVMGYSKWNLGIGESAPVQLDTRGKLKHSGLKHQGLKHKGLK